MAAGIPITTMRHPNFVMQLMMVKGSFNSFIAMRKGRVSSPISANMT